MPSWSTTRSRGRGGSERRALFRCESAEQAHRGRLATTSSSRLDPVPFTFLPQPFLMRRRTPPARPPAALSFAPAVTSSLFALIVTSCRHTSTRCTSNRATARSSSSCPVYRAASSPASSPGSRRAAGCRLASVGSASTTKRRAHHRSTSTRAGSSSRRRRPKQPPLHERSSTPSFRRATPARSTASSYRGSTTGLSPLEAPAPCRSSCTNRTTSSRRQLADSPRLSSSRTASPASRPPRGRNSTRRSACTKRRARAGTLTATSSSRRRRSSPTSSRRRQRAAQRSPTSTMLSKRSKRRVGQR